MTSQAISGGAKGAAAGYKVGGAWGAVVGAAVGIGGGLLGDAAAKYRRKATKEEQRSAELQQVYQRRSIWRSMYLARQEALAAGATETGGLQSSAPQGVLSSIAAKGTSNLKLFDALVARQHMQKYYLKKAGKKQEQADLVFGAIEAVGGSGMSFGGGGGGGSTSSSSSSSGSAGMGSSSSNFFTMDMGDTGK